MQLYLVPLEGGAWFKKKSPLEKISFLVDWPLSERKGHKMLVCPLARRWCKTPKIFYMKHLILIKVRSADSAWLCIHPYVLQKVYMWTWKIKKMDQFLERLVSPVWSFLILFFSGWIPIWSMEACHVYLLALASKTHARGSPRWGTLRYSSGRRWPT